MYRIYLNIIQYLYILLLLDFGSFDSKSPLLVLLLLSLSVSESFITNCKKEVKFFWSYFSIFLELFSFSDYYFVVYSCFSVSFS